MPPLGDHYRPTGTARPGCREQEGCGDEARCLGAVLGEQSACLFILSVFLRLYPAGRIDHGQ